MTNETNTTTKTWIVKLSANWMLDHLDVWEAVCEALKTLQKQAPELFTRQPQMMIVETEDGIKITLE